MSYAKRIILCLLVCLTLFGIMGCSDNTQKDFSDVAVTTQNKEYAKDVDKIDITITNKSDKDVNYLPDFSLEKNVDGKWESVKKDRENTEDMICGVNKGASVEDIFYVHNCYDSLSEGEYRLVVYVSYNSDDISDRANAVYAEFSIKQNKAASSDKF